MPRYRGRFMHPDPSAPFPDDEGRSAAASGKPDGGDTSAPITQAVYTETVTPPIPDAMGSENDPFLADIRKLIGMDEPSAETPSAPTPSKAPMDDTIMSIKKLIGDGEDEPPVAEEPEPTTQKPVEPAEKAPEAPKPPMDDTIMSIKKLIGDGEDEPPMAEGPAPIAEKTAAPTEKAPEAPKPPMDDTIMSIKKLIGDDTDEPPMAEGPAPIAQKPAEPTEKAPEAPKPPMDDTIMSIKKLIGDGEDEPPMAEEPEPIAQKPVEPAEKAPEAPKPPMDDTIMSIKKLIGDSVDEPPVAEEPEPIAQKPAEPAENTPAVPAVETPAVPEKTQAQPDDTIADIKKLIGSEPEAAPVPETVVSGGAAKDDTLIRSVDKLLASMVDTPANPIQAEAGAAPVEPALKAPEAPAEVADAAGLSDEALLADIKKLLVPVEDTPAVSVPQPAAPQPAQPAAPVQRREHPRRSAPERPHAPVQNAPRAPQTRPEAPARRPRPAPQKKAAPPASQAPARAKRSAPAAPHAPARSTAQSAAPVKAPPTAGKTARQRPAEPAHAKRPPRSGVAVANRPAAPQGKANSPKKRRRKPLNRWWLLLAFWVAGALPEMLLHCFTANGASTLFSSGLILSLLFAAVPALVLYGITLVIPKPMINRIIFIVYCGIVFILCASQLVYYRIFGVFYSAFSVANGGEAIQFWKIGVAAIWERLILIALMAIPFVFSFFSQRFFSFRPLKRWVLGVPPVAAALLLQLLLVLCLPLFGGTAAMSAYDLYHNNSDSYFSINRLGLLTAFRLDVTRMVTGVQPSGTMQLSSTPTEPTEETVQSTEAPSYDTSPNVLPLDFETLINNESNSDIREVHQYFNQRTPSNKNAYTGMFKGCNLIMLTAESFDYLAVSEERTPTLYKLMHEGIYFSDYYVPSWGVSTQDGEYTFLTSTIPKTGVWSFYLSSRNYMPLPISRQLVAQGYGAYAYHGNSYDYYHRDLYLPNLGFSYKALGLGLDVENTWPQSDVEVVEKSIGDYVNNQPFVTYYMTISGHQLYTFKDNYIAYKNRELVADEPYSDNVRAYLACQIELEKSMELLLQKLEEAGALENTVIVLTADHYPYGLTNDEMSELLGHDVETNFELYKNGCIIYKAGMDPVTIDAPTSHFDLLPTLLNLFGINFDSRLYMGRDVFSNAEPLVFFQNRSWITNVASYNALTGDVFYNPEITHDPDYAQRISNEVSNRFTVSSRILDYNYWDVLF